MDVTYEHTVVIRTNGKHTLTLMVKDGKITAMYNNNVVIIEKYNDIDTLVEIIYSFTKRSHYISKKLIRETLEKIGIK